MSRGQHILAFTGLGVAVALAATLVSQAGPLTAERRGDRLRLAAPLHFLDGRPLERLQNGAAVTFLLTVTVSPAADGRQAVSLAIPFIVSYDLWEERFSVVHGETTSRTASHLTARAAEEWCVENLNVPVAIVPKEKPFVLKLACSVPDETAPRSDTATTSSLAALIDVFSRQRPAPPSRWEALSGLLRLTTLQDKRQP